jgi:hypothetical protein
MMGACGADDDVGVILRQMFQKLRFQMIDHTQALTADPELPRQNRLLSPRSDPLAEVTCEEPRLVALPLPHLSACPPDLQNHGGLLRSTDQAGRSCPSANP